MTAFFEDVLFPDALVVGCSPHEFWDEEPKLFWTYCKAFRERKESEAKIWQERANASAWLAGIYIMQAVGACFPGGAQYPSRPQPLFQSCQTEEEQEIFAAPVDPTQESIRAQSIKIDALLAKEKELPQETIGPKRT